MERRAEVCEGGGGGGRGQAVSPVRAGLMKDEWGRQWWEGERGCGRCLAELLCVCVRQGFCAWRSRASPTVGWLVLDNSDDIVHTVRLRSKWSTTIKTHSRSVTQKHMQAAPRLQLLPPVSVKSIISTRTASQALLTYSDLPSIMLSVTLWTPSFSHPSDSVQNPSSAVSPNLFQYPTLPVYTAFNPSISLLPLSEFTFCLPLIVVLNILRAAGEKQGSSLDENSFPRVEGGQTEKSSWPRSHFLCSQTDCPTSIFFLFLQTNNTPYGAKTRL